MNFEFISNSKPVNKTASRILNSGIHYDYDVKNKSYHSENPMPIICKEKIQLLKLNPLFIDFTGYTHGYFKVIGLCRDFNKRWLVRCSCGDYEIRSTKAIKNHITNNHSTDRCAKCEDLKRIRKIASAKQMGYEYKEYCRAFVNDKD